MLVLYTIIGNSLALTTSVTVFVLFYLVWLLMIPVCVTTARSLGVAPLVCYGAAGCIVNLVFALSTWLGASLLAGEMSFGAATISVCMLLVVYVFMMTFALLGRRTPKKNTPAASLVSNTVGTSSMSDMSNTSDMSSASDTPGQTPGQSDLPLTTEQLCLELATTYLLTPRESDVLNLLASGRDAPYIAEQLFISKNTTRSHIKSIYAKIDIHSRQELLSFLESQRKTSPRA